MFAIVLAAAIALHSFEPVNATGKIVTYQGRQALHLMPGAERGDTHVLALIKDAALRDGTIEVDVAGVPRADAPATARGFVGVAFHVEGKGDRYELIYLRPGNGRADDQFRRNHTTQYAAHPDFPWHQLRKDQPGVYESYVDVETGAWTKIRIVIAGTTAKLYVNGAAQPCLIVKDLKHGGAGGGIALWSHGTTDAYFSNLKVR